MTLFSFLLVGLGGGAGASSRFALSNLAKRLLPGSFPFGTFSINILGSFLLGCMMAAQPGHSMYLLAGTGFMGGFTTFSTFNMECISMLYKKEFPLFILYLAGSYLLCIGAAAAGMVLMNA